MLAEHGKMARDYPDVRANTVASFALGDYEWILAFEADELYRIVDLMRHLRASEARRHVREEVPFYTGALVPDRRAGRPAAVTSTARAVSLFPFTARNGNRCTADPARNASAPADVPTRMRIPYAMYTRLSSDLRRVPSRPKRPAPRQSRRRRS